LREVWLYRQQRLRSVTKPALDFQITMRTARMYGLGDWPNIARSEAIRTSVFYQRIASPHSGTIPVDSNLL
jgi:hypothetical protein